MSGKYSLLFKIIVLLFFTSFNVLAQDELANDGKERIDMSPFSNSTNHWYDFFYKLIGNRSLTGKGLSIKKPK